MTRRISVSALLVVVLLAAPAWAGRNAFVDPVTGMLKAHGFVDRNDSGDLVVPVADEFSLVPRVWRWTGATWAPFVPPPTPPEQRRAALEAHAAALYQDPAIPARLKDLLRGLLERVP